MKGVTILLVEDDQNDVFWFRRCLGAIDANVSVQVVESAWRAREYLEGERTFEDRSYYPLPDLIVTDVHLPGANAIDFLRWLKADSRFRHIPVFSYSGSMRAEECQALDELGIFAQYTKTPNFEQAQKNVRAILDKASSASDGRFSHLA